MSTTVPASDGSASPVKWKLQNRTVRDLVSGFESGVLIVNDEYQRGEQWSAAQKGGFIDSILRGYPVPALILYKRDIVTMGTKNTKWEIIDGQQRVRAIKGYCSDKAFKLPDLDSGRFRVPKAVREKPVPWRNRYFEDLPETEQERLLDCELLTIEVTRVEGLEELRDLFIRLQAGAPLTRQQVRDALPGKIGPFIDHLAGRGRKPPSIGLFGVVGRWGQPTDDDDHRDLYVEDRQTCAQLLRLFEARQGITADFVGVNAADLDGLYHANTDFDPKGQKAVDFQRLLNDCERIFDIAKDKSSKNKFRRVLLFAVLTIFIDLRKQPLNRIDTDLYNAMARSVRSVVAKKTLPSGKATSAKNIKAAVDALLETGLLEKVVRRDAQRLFPRPMQEEIWERDGGVCQVCKKPVLESADAEYDHILRWELGGPTTVENGRLVHKWCHERGRLAEDDD